MLVLLAIVYPFRRDFLVAYHKNRWIAASKNCIALSDQGNHRTILQQIKFSLFRASQKAEWDAEQNHRNALIALGYLQMQEFQFTNHFTDGTNGLSFSRSMFLTFSNRPIWTARFIGTNKIVVSATLEDMPKWKKLVADFDR